MTSTKKGLVTHITSALFILDSVAFPQNVHCGKKIGKYELFVHGPLFSSHSAHSQESAQSKE